MSHTVRDAAAADLPGILAIYNDAIATSTAVYTEAAQTLGDRQAWFAQRTALGYPVLVASGPAGEVLGFSSFGDFRPWPGYRHTVEHLVYVAAGARGQGIGHALVRPLFGLAAARGKHTMIAGIDAANAPSIRLHERLGFAHAGVLREVGTKFGRWLDLVFMQRMLDPPG